MLKTHSEIDGIQILIAGQGGAPILAFVACVKVSVEGKEELKEIRRTFRSKGYYYRVSIKDY